MKLLHRPKTQGFLMLLPSLLLVAVFVYGMLGANAKISLTDRHSMQPATGFVGLENYTQLFTDDDGRFVHSLTNLGLFVIVFVAGTMLMGFLWAFLLDRGLKGEAFFRTVYIFPFSISFIAAGVAWRWILNGATGDSAGGINLILQYLHLGTLENRWFLDPDWGMAAVAIPAIWQMSGYVMALFLAGFRGIPKELREASYVDGATTRQMYRHVIFPQLSPAALSALVVVTMIGVKVFDLIMSMTGTAYLSEVPAIYVWNMLVSSNYAKATAIATALLVIVALVIVPYLIVTIRREKAAGL